MSRLHPWLCGLALLSPFAAGAASHQPAPDLYFGEALYHAYQGDYFDAIARLDSEIGQYYSVDEPELDPLHLHIDKAELSVGDFELSYRVHNRASRAVKEAIELNVIAGARNEAAYRLARLYLQKGQIAQAQQALERMMGNVPPRIRDDVAFLNAQLHMANGRPAEAALILKDLLKVEAFGGFAAYNLGIALWQAGFTIEGAAHLEKAGQAAGDAPEIQAIRDKSNLVLGSRWLEKREFERARRYLDRVRLKGPFSNKALLSSGWANASLGHYERALVPWTILAERNKTDEAVQEALLAVPHAYNNLKLHGKAALLYGNALEIFERELAAVDASTVSIQEGKFLKALLREELKQDPDWVIKLREWPESPETHYLIELLASNDFQESLKNYRDLDELRKKLSAWDEGITAFEEIIALRKKYYEPLLPDIDRQFRLLDGQMTLRLVQRQQLDESLKSMLISRRNDFLVQADERLVLDKLAGMEEMVNEDKGPKADELRRRIGRLKGVVTWRTETEYDSRLAEAYRHLREVDDDVKRLTLQYHSFVSSRQAATQSYEGYDAQLRDLQMRVRAARKKVDALMISHGQVLEAMAVAELEERRKRLEEFQKHAKFAMAESYDRAMSLQPVGRGKQQ